MKRIFLLAVLLLGAYPALSYAELGLSKIGNFNNPTYITATQTAPDKKFVTERRGVIRIIVKGKVRQKPFLSIKNKTTTRSEGGLLSMAFAPDYKKSGKFYVYYVDKKQNIRVDQFRRASATRAKRNSGKKVIEISSPNDTHKGGQLQMTAGGYLLFATGDGGNYMNPSSKPQSKQNLLGKLIRIKPMTDRKNNKKQYKVHPGNPFAGKKSGKGEIMSMGLRNPWRFSLDRNNPNKLIIADVGHSKQEEINYGSISKFSGKNFGWPCYEGKNKFRSCKVKNHQKPTLTYSHQNNRCSITGGYINRAKGLPQKGRYFYGDYCTGEIFSANLKKRNSKKTGINVPNLVSFGEDARGNLYTVSLSGRISKIINK